MAHLITNLENIYNTYFQPPYTVNETSTPITLEEYGKIETKGKSNSTIKGIKLLEDVNGVEVFLPVKLWLSDMNYLKIPCCTIRITSKKTIVRTAVAERKGTIKEQFSIGDYIITIKGVLIGEGRSFPDYEILQLKLFYESTVAIELHNALTELFFTDSRRIIIENLEFPEVKGGSKHHRPFVITCESDYVDNLEIVE